MSDPLLSRHRMIEHVEGRIPHYRALAESFAGDIDCPALIEGLAEAGLLYEFGKDFEGQLREQGRFRGIPKFMTLGRSRPKQWRDHGFYHSMGKLWLSLGRPARWTLQDHKDPNAQSPFQRFANAWLRVIDPARIALPSRSVVRRATEGLRPPI